MRGVTVIDDKLVALQEATDRYDQAEGALKDARDHLTEQVREARRSGASIDQLREVTGFSRGHVYDFLGGVTKPHSEARRARRKRITRAEGSP